MNTKSRENLPTTTILNWVFATNSDILIPISLQLDGVNRWYFKLRIFDLMEFIVWNI